jgi:16S rRNA (uracil1498-N3)-methyltransferase
MYDRRTLTESYTSNNDSVVLIGPEGDFSPEEVTFAVSHGFIPVSLGPCRLRTETAAIVAADTIHILSSISKK